jgi:hypothetical protein
MRRRLFNVLTAVSLLLCAATCGLWVRSYWVDDSFFWTDKAPSRILEWEEQGITCAAGGVQLFHHHAVERSGTLAVLGLLDGHHFDHFTERATDYPYFGFPWPPSECINVRFAGFQIFHAADANDRIEAGAFPLAAIAVSALVLPCMRVRREIKRRYSKNNLCLACGYDLRATAERCPECGAIPAGAAK